MVAPRGVARKGLGTSRSPGLLGRGAILLCMDAAALIDRLGRLPGALDALLAGLRDVDWRHRPPRGGWSILEILGHLLAEELEDFRARLEATLTDPLQPWPPLDPEGAVVERRFNEAQPQEVLRRFREERARSVAWLRALEDPRWDVVHPHPKPPPLHAGDLLASWAAHDARHLEQIAKRLHALAARDGAPYEVGYAG